MISFGFVIVFVIFSILKSAIAYAGLGVVFIHAGLRLRARRLSAAYHADNFPPNPLIG